MLRDVAVIVTFLFLTISSIIFFRNEYEISTLVSIIAVFISGAIPSLFLKGLTRGKNFSGWRKIQLERKIKVAVREYEREVNSVGKNWETVGGGSFQNDSCIVVLNNASQAAQGRFTRGKPVHLRKSDPAIQSESEEVTSSRNWPK